MKNRTILFVAILYFCILIAFEASQQHYYMTRFQLEGYNSVTVFDLMGRHAFRWGLWILIAIPLALYTYRNPARELSSKHIARYGIGIVITLFLTLLAISFQEVASIGFNISQFKQVLLFFTFQKSALFINAYVGLIVLINLYFNVKLLDSKLVELSDLITENKTLYDQISTNKKNETTLIQIKIGNKVKNVLLSEIVWVQSDDYCVKIHTADKSYNLRKSMKLVEKELESKGFVRLHRNSIVNKEEVDAISYAPKAHVLLKNGQHLAIATGRISKVRESFKGVFDFD